MYTIGRRILRNISTHKTHQELGKQYYFSHQYSPGSAFFTPEGTHIYNTLTQLIRKELTTRSYQEVITPNIYNTTLWKISGHFKHFINDMIQLRNNYALKPMNCPAHCLLYKSVNRSYKSLPIKYSELGVLHRNEPSGSLNGLIRARRFV